MEKLRRINGSLVFSKSRVIILSFMILLFVLNTCSFSASAAGLLEESESNGLMYSKYPYERYSLDYGSSGWFDFDAVFNGIANCFFFLCNCLGNFTGSLVKEAYSLDFVKDFSDEIGSTIQSVSGVNADGIHSGGLFYGFLLLLIIVLGLYVAYNGLIKRSTSKVLSAIFNFVVIFVVGICFISYSPTLLRNVADFSGDINSTVLSASSFAFHNGEDTSSYDESELIYENVWNVMVYQPWCLLEFGTTDVEFERVENLLRCEYGSDERAEAADLEIDEYDNNNIKNTSMKLGTTFLMLIVDVVLCLFILLLAGMLIVSQFLFIIFCCLMPFIFVFAMLPNMTGKLMKSVMYLFNLFIAKCAITLILTLAFTLSSMFLSISVNTNYIFTAFLQIICFVGIFKFMPKMLAMIGIDASDIMRSGHPAKIKRGLKQGSRKVRAMLPVGKKKQSLPGQNRTSKSRQTVSSGSAVNSSGRSEHKSNRSNNLQVNAKKLDEDKIKNKSAGTLGGRIGSRTGIMSLGAIRHNAGLVKDKIISSPVNVRHAISKSSSKARERFKNGLDNTRKKISGNYVDFVSARAVRQSQKRNAAQKRREDYNGDVLTKQLMLDNAKRRKIQNKELDKQVQQLDRERPDVINRRKFIEQKKGIPKKEESIETANKLRGTAVLNGKPVQSKQTVHSGIRVNFSMKKGRNNKE